MHVISVHLSWVRSFITLDEKRKDFFQAEHISDITISITMHQCTRTSFHGCLILVDECVTIIPLLSLNLDVYDMNPHVTP